MTEFPTELLFPDGILLDETLRWTIRLLQLALQFVEVVLLVFVIIRVGGAFREISDAINAALLVQPIREPPAPHWLEPAPFDRRDGPVNGSGGRRDLAEGGAGQPPPGLHRVAKSG